MFKKSKHSALGLSTFLGFASWLLLGIAWMQVPDGGLADKVIGTLATPGYRTGHLIGAFLFPNYETRYSTGSYLVPLFGVGGNLLFLIAFFYFCIRITRALQHEETLPDSDYESIKARREEWKDRHFDGEYEPNFVPKSRSMVFWSIGGLFDFVDHERFKLQVWREFHDHTGTWPLLSICFHYATWIGFLVGVIAFLFVRDSHGWGQGLSLAIGLPIAAVYLVLVFVGEPWMRKLDWRLFGRSSREA